MTDELNVGEQLREPFPVKVLGWKPQAVKGNRALAVAYIDARDVMQRLDDVVGVGNWQDDYKFLEGGQVMCRLSVRIGGEWVTKCDVGGESEQPDKGDREKAAVSDALKRAAVKFGVGRYLYSMPSAWCDFDPVKKQFTATPDVPREFLPRGHPAALRPAPQPQQPPAPSPADQFRAHIAAAKTIEELVKVWGTVPPTMHGALAADKDRRKAELTKPAAE